MNNSSALKLASLLPLILSSTLGCDKSEPPTKEAVPAQASAESASGTLSAGVVKTASVTATASPKKEKEFAATDEQELGTLPDGLGLAVGESMGELSLADHAGKHISLGELAKSKGPLLLVFYRGGWCPYCTFQIRELTKAFPEYQKRGVLPVAISVDQPSKASETQASYEIPFPVLSDPELVAHQRFRVVHEADEAEFQKLKGYGIDLEGASGKQHHKFAVPGLFVVDKAGAVLWAHADADYKTRPKTAQVLKALDGLKGLSN